MEKTGLDLRSGCEAGGDAIVEERHSPTRILKNSIFILASRAVQISSAFLVAVAVARYLSVERYGEYSYIIAFVSSVMTLAYFGIQQVLIREIVNDRPAAGRIFGAAIYLRFILTALATLALAVSMYFVKPEGRLLAAGLIIIASEIFLSFSMLARSLFQAYEKMMYDTVATVVYCVVLSAGIAAVILFDMGFLWLFGATAFANLSQLVLCYRLLSRRFVRPSFDFDRAVFRSYMKDAAVIGVGIFFYQNLFRVNVLMLKWLGGIEDVAYFQIAHNLIMQLQVIPFAFVTALFPVISRLLREDPVKMRDACEKIFRYTLIFGLFASIFIFVFSEQIIVTVFGPKYSRSAASLMIVSWAAAPLSLDLLINSLLIAMNKQRYAVIYAGVTLLLNLLLAVLLVPSHGFMAASWLALSSYVLLLVFSFYFVSKNGFGGIGGAALLKTLLSGATGVAAIYLLRPFSPMLAFAAATCLYFGSLYKMGAFRTGELAFLRSLYSNSGRG